MDESSDFKDIVVTIRDFFVVVHQAVHGALSYSVAVVVFTWVVFYHLLSNMRKKLCQCHHENK